MANHFILELGSRYRAWRIVEGAPYPLIDKEFYTIEPTLQYISKANAGDEDSATFLVHKYATAIDVGYINKIVGHHILQCTPEFTLHDAIYRYASQGVSKDGTTLGIIDDGESGYSAAMSFYVNGKVVLRAFGVNKSLRAFISYTLAEAGLFAPEEIAGVSRDDGRKLDKLAEEYALKMYKDIMSFTKLSSEFDVMMNQGATVAWRIACNKKLRSVHNKLYRKEIDKGVTSYFVMSVVNQIFAMLLQGFKFDQVILGGELFNQDWVSAIVQSMTSSEVISRPTRPVDAGMGMYLQYQEAVNG